MKPLFWLGCFGCFASVAWASLPVEPGVDGLTKRKMDWLEKRGTPIRYGSDDARWGTVACRIGNKVYLRRQWGIEQTWVNDEVATCPPFFGPSAP
ncbi:MAG: hypothetical protein RRB13_00965 [bacterium]|nr:hypothetical protein [bacterium]